ncbi:hypothetical protein pb186bvf_018310 [Paramecium bursaria]
MDQYHNCDNTKEQQLQVKYFANIDIDAPIQEKVKNKQFKTPLDYNERNQKSDNLMSYGQVRLDDDNVTKQFGRPRVITHNSQVLIIGGSLGNVLIISNNTELITQTEKQGAVTSLDADLRYCIVGYETGAIGIIKIKKCRFMKVIKEVLQYRILINRLIFRNIKSYFSAILSDEVGCTRIIHWKQGMFGDYEYQLALKQQQYPIISISVMEEQESLKIIKYSEKEKFRILIVSSLAYMNILVAFKDRYKQLESLLMIENPHLQSPEKVLYTNVTYGYGLLNNQQQLMVVLTWNSHLYVLYQEEQQWIQLNPLLFIKQQIQHICFISEGILGITTWNQNLYLINTQDLDLFQRAKSINQIQHLIYNKGDQDRALTTTYTIPSLKTEHEYSDQFICAVGPYAYSSVLNRVYILVGEKINTKTLNSWETAIDLLILNKEWSNAMFLILSMNMKYSPQKYDDNKIYLKTQEVAKNYLKVICEQIKQTLDKYKTLDLKYPQQGEQEVKRIKTFLSLLIDFLLKTQPKILFNEIYKILKVFLKDKNDLFCNELRDYVLNNRVKNIEIEDQVLDDILKYYRSQNEVRTIENLLFSINLQSINTKPLVQLCLELKLIKALSHICIEDIISPLSKLWGEIQKPNKIEIQIENGVNLIEFLELVVDGIQKEQIIQLSIWIFDEKSLRTLLCVDMIKAFKILCKFFEYPFDQANTKQQLQQYWNNLQAQVQFLLNNKEKFDKQQLFDSQRKKYNLTMKLIQLLCDTYKSFLILRDHYQMQQQDLEQMICSMMLETNHLIYIPQYKFNLPAITDQDDLTYRFSLLYGYNYLIIQLLEKFSFINLDEILMKTVYGEFDYVQVYIQERLGNYINALDIKMVIYNKTLKYNIVRDEESIFKWIVDILEKCSNNIIQFKERILYHLGTLVKIGALKTRQIISKYFQASDKSILSKLESLPHLQLEYLEHIIKSEQPSDDILKLHLNLLCKLKPEEVLQKLQLRQYPLDDVIVICKQYEINDALAYALDRSGNIKEVIKVKGNQITKMMMNKTIKSKQQLTDMLDEICHLCYRNQEYGVDDLWDSFAQKLIYLAFHNTTPQQYKQYLDEYISILFKNWAQATQLEKFIDKVIEKYCYLSVPKLLDSFKYLYSIIQFSENHYQKLTDIYEKSCIQKQMILPIEQSKGLLYAPICYYCYRLIDINDYFSILVLGCSHLFHYQCFQMNYSQYYHCPLCIRDPLLLYRSISKYQGLINKQLKDNQFIIQQQGNQQKLVQNKITAQIIEQGDKRDKQLKEIYLNQVEGQIIEI